jgi:serine protease AprX
MILLNKHQANRNDPGETAKMMGLLAFLLTASTAMAAGDVPALSLPVIYHTDSEGNAVLWVEWQEPAWDAVTLAAKLAEIDRSLDPRCRARRLKEGRALAADINDLPPPTKLLDALHKIPGLKVRVTAKSIKSISVTVPPEQMQRLTAIPGVKSVTAVAARPAEEFTFHAADSPPNESSPWGYAEEQLTQINLIALQQAGYHGEGIIIGVLDTGFRLTHQCLQNINIMASHDFTTDHQLDLNANHGTAILSEIAGYDPGNYLGGAYRAGFILCKTELINVEIPAEEDNYVAGLEWCESLGADVVTSSLGYIDWYSYAELDGLRSPCSRAVNVAAGRGVVVTTAAGNQEGSAKPFVIAPADSFGGIAIGAVDYTGNIAGFSSRGPLVDGRRKPDVCARGVDTWHAHPFIDDQYADSNGTSCSTPLAGSSAVLLRQAHPDWSAAQVADSLRLTASIAQNPDDTYGWGIVNAFDASNYTPLDPDPPGPQVSAYAQPESFFPNNDGMNDTTTFFLSASDADGIEHWELAIYPMASLPGNLAMIFVGAGNPPAELVWNGRGLANLIVAPGDYRFHFSAWDRYGHRNRTPDAMLHVDSQADALSRIIAYPNPVRPSAGQRAVYFSYMPAQSSVAIYDLAGGRLTELNTGANGEAVWEIGGTRTASGIYLWVVRTPWGSRTGKIAVIR